MVMKVFITYKAKEAVTYCFWKYFFESCGVWVSEAEITGNWDGTFKSGSQLVILDEDEYEVVKAKVIPHNCVFHIGKEELTFSYAKQVLQWLFEGHDELDELLNLMRIFVETGLWGASWLFHEITQSEKNFRKQEIVECCRQVSEQLCNNRRWHSRFMRLYCDYIKRGVADKDCYDEAMHLKHIDYLLEQCGDLINLRPKSPVIWLLAGKICMLSADSNKRAIDMYLRAANYEPKPQFYYEIGHIFEQAYGNEATAYEYYKKIQEKCPSFYRAIYKLAVKAEADGQWMRAINYYIDVKRILKDRAGGECITIREVEYIYKVNRNILNICKKNIIDDRIAIHYQKEIEEIYIQLDEIMDLNRLVSCMFRSEEANTIFYEIIDIVREKFSKQCFQTKKLELCKQY